MRARYPEVACALDWLGHFAPARLTGTGACIFAPCAAEDEAQDIVTRVPAPWRGMVVRGMNVSPLLALRA